MQKHDAKKAAGTSGTQQPSQKTGPSDPDNQKPMQKSDNDRIKKSDDSFNSPQRSK